MVMGIGTTSIFWVTETAFWFVWKTDIMREFGAIIGLSIGYTIKYRLDRRFVFTDARLVQDNGIDEGRYPGIDARVSAPRTVEALQALVRQGNAIARGMGVLMVTVLLVLKTPF